MRVARENAGEAEGKAMKTRYIIITLVCFSLIALLLIADRYFTVEPEPIPEPERDWGGLRAQQMVAVPEPSAEPEMYFTEDDVIAVAKMLWGEARGCEDEIAPQFGGERKTVCSEDDIKKLQKIYETVKGEQR